MDRWTKAGGNFADLKFYVGLTVSTIIVGCACYAILQMSLS